MHSELAPEIPPPPDLVNRPPHYTQHPLECIFVTEQLSFCLGNAVKYCWRHSSKGSSAADLRKAAWFLRREARRLKRCWFGARIWQRWKLWRLLEAHDQELPSLVALLLQDVLEGEFEGAALYCEGLAVLEEGN